MGLDLSTMLYVTEPRFLPMRSQLKAAVRMMTERGLLQPASLDRTLAEIDTRPWNTRRWTRVHLAAMRGEPGQSERLHPSMRVLRELGEEPTRLDFREDWCWEIPPGPSSLTRRQCRVEREGQPLMPACEPHPAARGRPVPGFSCWHEHFAREGGLHFEYSPGPLFHGKDSRFRFGAYRGRAWARRWGRLYNRTVDVHLLEDVLLEEVPKQLGWLLDELEGIFGVSFRVFVEWSV